VNCFIFRAAVFFHVVPKKLRTDNGVSFYLCSAVGVAWLSQKIRHSGISVRSRLVGFKCL